MTGKLPFTGANLHELSQQIFYAAPTPPSKCSAEPIDAHLEAVVFHLLEKSLTERTASAEELLRELGYKGAPTVVASAPAARVRTPTAGKASPDRRLRRGLVKLQILAGAFLLIYATQKGFTSGGFLVLGLVLFYLGCRRERWGPAGRAWAVTGGWRRWPSRPSWVAAAWNKRRCSPSSPRLAPPGRRWHDSSAWRKSAPS